MKFYIIFYSISRVDVDLYLTFLEVLKELSYGKFAPLDECSFVIRTDKKMDEIARRFENFNSIYISEAELVALRNYLRPKVFSWLDESA